MPTKRKPHSHGRTTLVNTVEITAEGLEPPPWMPETTSIVSSTLTAAGKSEWEVSVLLCTDSRMAELNKTFRDTDGATDVLTFSQTEGVTPPGTGQYICAGDIAISVPSVVQNANLNSVEPVEEFVRVLVHGLLHLAGYDHDGVDMSSPSFREHPMLSLQENLVSSFIEEYRS